MSVDATNHTTWLLLLKIDQTIEVKTAAEPIKSYFFHQAIGNLNSSLMKGMTYVVCSAHYIFNYRTEET